PYPGPHAGRDFRLNHADGRINPAEPTRTPSGRGCRGPAPGDPGLEMGEGLLEREAVPGQVIIIPVRWHGLVFPLEIRVERRAAAAADRPTPFAARDDFMIRVDP